MTKSLPSDFLQMATPADRELVEDARRRGTLQITWPERNALRQWAGKHGWRAPRFGFEESFTAKMLESEETFALALNESGIRLVVPSARYTLPPERLRNFDEWYDERGADGRPSAWGNLVEALRDVRRAVEAGIAVEIDGRTFRQFGDFYEWAHGRYHMLEDGYDRWIGDDL